MKSKKDEIIFIKYSFGKGKRFTTPRPPTPTPKNLHVTVGREGIS